MNKRANSAVSFSHAEFDALPHSVQRKYFSSLERLRISEQQSQSFLNEQLNHDSSRRSSRSHARSLVLHPSLGALSLGRRRLRKADSARIDLKLAQQESQFFLSLPPKVRRQYFTREEQVFLLGRCDQADQPFLPNPRARAQQRFGDFQFGFNFNDNDNASTPERGRSRRRSRSISPTRAPLHQDPKVIEDDTMSPPLSHQPAPRGPKFRRTLSLGHIPLPSRTSTSSVPVPGLREPPLTPLSLVGFGTQQWHRPTSMSRSGRRSSHTPTVPVFDPEATHYQDPEARKKLRMFLGSPQKFDEAVEFGFPSTAGDDTIPPPYQLPPITTDARNFSKDMHTFLRDDKMSFLEDNENEDEDDKLETDVESVTDLESPVTPSSIGVSFRGHMRHASPSNFSSLDYNGLPPYHIQGRHGLNREMTLRMTLTRPDLRADEDQLYGWQGPKAIKDDPFALEELHLTDDMTGANGAFAIKPKPHGNLVSRLFKRTGKKGRA